VSLVLRGLTDSHLLKNSECAHVSQAGQPTASGEHYNPKDLDGGIPHLADRFLISSRDQSREG
jgi:hypothetical protein